MLGAMMMVKANMIILMGDGLVITVAEKVN